MIPMDQREPQPIRTNSTYKESSIRYNGSRYEETNSRYDDSIYNGRPSRYEEANIRYENTLRTDSRYEERLSIFGGSQRADSRYEERPSIFGVNQRANNSSRYDEKPVGGFRIRGISNVVESPTPTTYRNELGPPTTVLVTGLDVYATATDVRVSSPTPMKNPCLFYFYEMQMFLDGFGQILECEILKNRAGHSFGEAEVLFDSKAAALECIAKLDNQMADGKSETFYW
jgi:hypothetical protein